MMPRALAGGSPRPPGILRGVKIAWGPIAAVLVVLVLRAVPAGAEEALLEYGAPAGPPQYGRFQIVLTRRDGRARIDLDGAIVAPLAATFRSLLALVPEDEPVLLDLNSPGGSVLEGRRLIAVLRAQRLHRRIDTRVGDRRTCASMCIAVYMQGRARYAAPASLWGFHGIYDSRGGLPDPAATAAFYTEAMRDGVRPRWVERVREARVFLRPVTLWVTGRGLYDADAGVVTRLLPPAATEVLHAWRPPDPES